MENIQETKTTETSIVIELKHQEIKNIVYIENNKLDFMDLRVNHYPKIKNSKYDELTIRSKRHLQAIIKVLTHTLAILEGAK